MLHHCHNNFRTSQHCCSTQNVQCTNSNVQCLNSNIQCPNSKLQCLISCQLNFLTILPLLELDSEAAPSCFWLNHFATEIDQKLDCDWKWFVVGWTQDTWWSKMDNYFSNMHHVYKSYLARPAQPDIGGAPAENQIVIHTIY